MLLCDKTFPGGHNAYLCSTQWDPRTDQSRDTTKVQFGKLVSFIGITYRNVCEGLLIAAAMTQSSISKAHSSVGEAYCTEYRLVIGLECSFLVPQLL